MTLSEDNESSLSNFDQDNEGDDATNESSVELNKDSDQSIDYNFGWNRYSELMNGRFAMIGFLSLLIIELLSKKSFFSWTGILK